MYVEQKDENLGEHHSTLRARQPNVIHITKLMRRHLTDRLFQHLN